MKNISTMDRLRYKFDNLMSKGAIALIGALFVLSVALVIIISFLVSFIAPEGSEMGLGRLVWMSVMRTLDPGTMGGDEGSFIFVGSMFLVTLGGIFVVSTLIGVLSSGIESKLDELRKGRSLVIEEDHTVILGWSPQVFSIISELVIANANRKNACIAILSNEDKVEMEDEIRLKVPDTKNTRIVCRHGDPMDLTDLEIISPHSARSIIILSPDAEDPDSQVIKTILALTNNPNRRAGAYHIVATIHNARNIEAARLVSRGEAQLLLADDLIARITAQTCRLSGLSVVYTELLDFGGDEIYFKDEPSLVGMTFGEALFCYEDSTMIGLRYQNGMISLNPPMDTVIQPDDKIIAISADDDTIHLSGLSDYQVDQASIMLQRPRPQSPERTLILGWNHLAPQIINELDQYVPQGSEVVVVAEVEEGKMEISCNCDNLQNQKVQFHPGVTTDRRTLDALDIDSFRHVILLSYSGILPTQEADARTLVTLLHLREIAEKCGHPFSIVSEMLDIRNRALAEVTDVDDFIVSNRLISLMLSQVAENKELSAVFADFFDPDGSEIYLKPVEDYVSLGEPLNFYTVMEAARRRGEVAMGYRLGSKSNNAAEAYGVKINPKKSLPITFSEEDRVIVLAEE